MAFCRRQGLPLSIVFFDIDNMKNINDSYGHAIGDFVLTTLTKLVKNQLRGSDSLARWGGDEFVILLPSVTLANATALTERIGNRIQEYTFIEGYCVTCSFGVVEMKAGSDFETMVSQADKLMYDSKKHGKNSVHCTK